MWKCDKCGKEVPLSNDAVAFQFICEHGNLPGVFERLQYGARHLLPTEDCEGSPSRAQYLIGQPRDTRGYAYKVEQEKGCRESYQKLRELANAN